MKQNEYFKDVCGNVCEIKCTYQIHSCIRLLKKKNRTPYSFIMFVIDTIHIAVYLDALNLVQKHNISVMFIIMLKGCFKGQARNVAIDHL